MHTSIDKRMPAQTITVDEIVPLDFGYITAKCRKYSCCDTPSFDFHTLSITGSILLVWNTFLLCLNQVSCCILRDGLKRATDTNHKFL